jgi:hypothetical protein
LPRNENGGATECAAVRTHEIVLLRRAGVPLAVIAQIRSRCRIVGFVPPHAIRHGIIADRGRCCDNGLVVIIGVVVIVRVAVVAIGGPDASTDREARPEAVTVVTMMMMMTAAAVPAASCYGTSTDSPSAGNGATSEAAITAGRNGHAATSEAAIAAGRHGRAAAGCNGHAATSKDATTTGCNGAAAASEATAAADSCTATAHRRTAAAHSRTATSPGTAASFLRLDSADTRRD